MPAPPLALAGIDVGTNSLLLTIARPAPHGLLVLDERCVTTRLGEGQRDRGPLAEAAAERTLDVLAEFGAALVATGARARAAGTSVLRRASDAGAFVARASDALGVALEVLSGAEEARLSRRGALVDLPGVSIADRPIVVDPGGGSTEIVRAGDEQALSVELGAVRLTEELVAHDPPLAEELAALDARIGELLAGVATAEGRPVVAVGGTATTLAALSLRLERYDGRIVHGSLLPVDEIAWLRRRLAAMPLAARERLPSVPPGRADIIVAGASILSGLVGRLEAPHVVVSDRGLRYGLIVEMLEGYPAMRKP